jgi:hypothetical protein
MRHKAVAEGNPILQCSAVNYTCVKVIEITVTGVRKHIKEAEERRM